MNNHKLIRILGTWFGLGDFPFMPGTFGTLGGIPVYILLVLIKPLFLNTMVYNSFYFIFLVTFLQYQFMLQILVKKKSLKKKIHRL